MQPTAINAILQVIEIRKATIAPPGRSDLTLATELDIRIDAGTAPYLRTGPHPSLPESSAQRLASNRDFGLDGFIGTFSLGYFHWDSFIRMYASTSDRLQCHMLRGACCSVALHAACCML
jgi:hypothetical protein